MPPQNLTEQYFFFSNLQDTSTEWVLSSQGPITTSTVFQIMNFGLLCCYVQVKLFLSNYWQKQSSIFWNKSSKLSTCMVPNISLKQIQIRIHDLLFDFLDQMNNSYLVKKSYNFNAISQEFEPQLWHACIVYTHVKLVL